MDINDVLGMGGHTARPTHPDFYRILEISQQMRAEITEATGDYKRQERIWRRRIATIGDFDSINYHAIQIALSIVYKQYGDLPAILADKDKMASYAGTMQAFYDGFLMGATFEQRGGHQEVPA